MSQSEIAQALNGWRPGGYVDTYRTELRKLLEECFTEGTTDEKIRKKARFIGGALAAAKSAMLAFLRRHLDEEKMDLVYQIAY